MSNMITLRTRKVNRFGRSVILSGIEVKFDNFGLADVMERHAEALVIAGLELVDKEDVVKFEAIKNEVIVPDIDVIDENTKLKAKVELLTLENETMKKQMVDMAKSGVVIGGDKEEDSIDIDSMTSKQLKEVCKDLEYPEKEWKNLKIEDLKNYIKSKL